VLFNSTKYSNTTTHHQGVVENAVSHKTKFYVPNVSDPKAVENVEYLASQAADEYTRILTQRFAYSTGLADLKAAIKTHNEYLRVFKIKGVKPIELSALDEQILTRLTVVQRRALELDRAERSERWKAAQEQAERDRAERKAKALADFEAWKRGENVQFNDYYIPKQEFDVLRVKNGVVETHRGASVPLNIVCGLLAKLDAGAKVSGLHLGEYTITSKSGDVIKIGCHTFKISEARKVIENSLNPSALVLVQGAK